jgi:hypothetical protein
LDGHTGSVSSVCFNHDGSRIVSIILFAYGIRVQVRLKVKYLFSHGWMKGICFSRMVFLFVFGFLLLSRRG